MSALFDGVKEVVHSPFLAAIVGLVAFYEMASQVMDYQLSYMLEGLSGVYATQAWFADIRFYTNVLSVFVQFLLVSFVMRRFGLIAALLVLPLGIAGFSGAFLLMPTLFVVGNMNIFQNGLNYSLQQTARESLWVSTTPEEGKARPFTNIFVQRTAKGLSIGLVMALQMLRLDIQYLSVITVLSAAAMILCSVFAGRVLQRKAR